MKAPAPPPARPSRSVANPAHRDSASTRSTGTPLTGRQLALLTQLRTIADTSPRQQAQQARLGKLQMPVVAGPHRHAPQPGPVEGTAVQRKVGFEFQMLSSKVGLFASKDAADQAVNPSSETKECKALPAVKFVVDGREWWKGENAEFATTEQYDDAEAAKSKAGEIAAKASELIGSTGVKALDDKFLRVWNTDASGQPQVNVDVDFDKVGRELDPQNEQTMGAYQSAEGAFGWKTAETKAFLESRKKIADTIQATYTGKYIFSQAIFDKNKPEITIDSEGVPERIAEFRKALNVWLSTYTTARLPMSTYLNKDVPMLPKVDLNELRDRMVAVSASYVKDAIDGWLQKQANRILKDSGVPQGGDRLNASNTAFSGTDTVSTKDRSTAVMEYRRVPVLPVGEWATFAGKAVTDLNGLGTPAQ